MIGGDRMKRSLRLEPLVAVARQQMEAIA